MLKSIQVIFGIYPRRILKNIRSITWYRRSRKEFNKQTKKLNTGFILKQNFPCLSDRYEEGGVASGHYFHQDLLVSQAIFKDQPTKHIDIGSRIDGLVAQIASYREVEVLDIRYLTSHITNVYFVQADCMALDTKYENYCDSISSLHAIEHFGLGRYGDPIDANGHIKGLEGIYTMLKPGGTFYFSVPMGDQRVEYNAHRVFGLEFLVNYFQPKYDIKSFSYVDDKGDLHKNIALTPELISSNCLCYYGCAIFILEKKD